MLKGNKYILKVVIFFILNLHNNIIVLKLGGNFMKFLGYLFLFIVLIAGGFLLAYFHVLDPVFNWIGSLFH